MSEDARPSFHLRMPPELKERLEQARGARSLNSEIVARLERSFAGEPDLFAEALKPLFAAMSDEDRRRARSLLREAASLLSRTIVPRRRSRRASRR